MKYGKQLANKLNFIMRLAASSTFPHFTIPTSFCVSPGGPTSHTTRGVPVGKIKTVEQKTTQGQGVRGHFPNESDRGITLISKRVVKINYYLL